MMLHLLSESKFDSLIMDQNEECFPGENLFLLFSAKRSLNLFNREFNSRIFFVDDQPAIDFSKINGIIIHYLSLPKAEFIKSLPENIPIGCSLWGGDFYNFLPEFKQNIYSSLTKKYLEHSRKLPEIYYRFKQIFIFPGSHNYKLWRNTLEKIKVYSTPVPYEKRLIEKYFKSNSKYFNLPTYSLEKAVNTDDYENTILTKESYRMKIFIGNSGNPTNNHLDILHFFKKFDCENINVHLPLTYGNDDYIDHICNAGNSLLGKKFHPLLKHLDNKEFTSYVNSFNIFIFNSYRQQGIGTIVMALWSGGKVFLSNRNITYSFYRDNGLKIFSVEEDLFGSRNNNLFNILTGEEILANRKVLLRLYTNEIVNSSIRKFTEYLKGSYI